MTLEIVLLAFLALNLLGFIMCARDKSAAKKDKWRIPEKNFFIVGLLWGATGVFAGMQVFRHKTRHWYFKFGMPVLMVINYLTLIKIIKLLGGFGDFFAAFLVV